MELVGPEMACRQQLQHVAFDDRPERFEEVEGEAGPVLLVGVPNPETRVQSEVMAASRHSISASA
jgi:hypothetical protein